MRTQADQRFATQHDADQRTLSTLAMIAVVAGAGAVLARSSLARRVAWAGVKFAVSTWLPAWGVTQVTQAWRDTAPVSRPVPAFSPASLDVADRE